MSSELDPSQGRLLGVLAVTVAERLGGDALLVDGDDRALRKLRVVRVGDFAVVDQPADDSGPRCINVYLVEGERAVRIDPSRLLYSLAWPHKATPPDLHLHLVRDPRDWFDAVSLTLLNELAKHDSTFHDQLHACFSPPQ